MIQKEFNNAESSLTVKNSWIYKHFDSGPGTKIALYVNELVPINKNLEKEQIQSVANHCVIVKRLHWLPRINKCNERCMVECFEIENFGSSRTRYIPVDHPFWEKVQADVIKIFNKYSGSEVYSKKLNQLGKRLAEIKYGLLEKDWYNQKTKNGDKYEMIFFRKHPCYQLKFQTVSD